jgi:tryptophan synthase alpha chain
MDARFPHLFSDTKPVIPFLTAGFPSVPIFLDAAAAACDAGAGALEIGMPFSDPLADGPAIQYSSQVALTAGVTMPRVIALTARLSAKLPVPIFLMGYLNPVMQMGFDRFASAVHAAGAAGTVIPDCPVDEAGDWRAASARAGLANIFLIAPTTPDERVALIDDCSTVFSYCVSVAGVTGVRRDVSASTRSFLRRVRRVAKKPFVVGFGISRPEHIRALKEYADGFVVGSVLVSILKDAPRSRAAADIGRTISGLVRAAG